MQPVTFAEWLESEGYDVLRRSFGGEELDYGPDAVHYDENKDPWKGIE